MNRLSGRGAVKLGDEARDREDWVTAAAQYRLHLERKPGDFAIWVQLGHALKEQGLHTEALTPYNIALSLDPNNSDLLLNLGHLHKFMGHLDTAISFYHRSADIDANVHALGELHGLGQIRERPAKSSPAPASRTNIAPPSGVLTLLTSNLAKILNRARRNHQACGDEARGRGDWATAAKHYRSHVEATPGDFAVWVQLGHALKESSQLQESLAAYNQALILKPLDADLLLNLGHLHKLMGSRDLAFDFYRRSAAQDGNANAIQELRLTRESIDGGFHQPAGESSHDSLTRADDLADAVDPQWYLRTYLDVAAVGMDPMEHYREYGRAEGRSPNAQTGSPRKAWAGRFDSHWYAARNGDLGEFNGDPFSHFVTVGLKEGRSPNPYEEPRETWVELLDVPWYLERNPDVRDAQLDPIEHYIHHGIREYRKPNRDTKLKSRPVMEAKIDCLKAGDISNEVALLITHSPDGRLKPHVGPYLDGLRQAGVSTVLIIASDKLDLDVPNEIKTLADVIYSRGNQGFDFAAWAHVIKITVNIYKSKILYLLNDSVFGPVGQRAFQDVLDRVHANEADLVGLTANWERGWHIQSYFLALKAPILQSNAFRDFIDSTVSYYNKDDVINEYETQLANYLKGNGFKCAALFNSPDKRNAPVFYWRELLDQGFPFLKISILWGAIYGANIDIRGWREKISRQGYNVKVADGTLAQLIASAKKPVRTEEHRKREFRREALVELHKFFAAGEVLELPISDRPQVSIIIVVYNQAELTLQCLKSIVQTVGNPVEVIIVDNASTDDTEYLLRNIRNARVLHNDHNIHFLRASNQGSEAALGETLLFLNSDTSLTDCAVENSLETLNGLDDVGAVGAKLILPDGTLQEAGSVVLRDGTCLGYGRGRSPDDLRCNYRRDVDYCSGAFLLIRRELFERMERFDTVYAPAYYEETDLCLRIWDRGLRVVYDPRVAVNHFEFGSSASSQTVIGLMQRNHKTFVARHRSALQRFHPAEGGPDHLMRSSRRRRAPRILMIDDLLPIVAHGAGFPRANTLAQSLIKAGFQVTHCPTGETGATLDELREYCPVDIEFILGRDQTSVLQLIEERTGFYDGIIVSRPHNMRAIRSHFLRTPEAYRNVALVYDAEAVWAPRDMVLHEMSGGIVTQAQRDAALEEELSLSDVADLIITVNRHDAAYFTALKRSNVQILGHSLKVKPTLNPFESRRDLLFVGKISDDVSPNVDSLLWFANDIMPRLDRMIGQEYRLLVVGKNKTRRLESLDKKRIHFLGGVADLSEIYDSARVFIAPTRFAAGVPHKVCEAAAFGLPTVVTPLLADQLDWRPGAVLAGDGADGFAEQCRRLYTDSDLWRVTRRMALIEVTAHCAPEKFDMDLVSHLRSVGLRGASSWGRAAHHVFRTEPLDEPNGVDPSGAT